MVITIDPYELNDSNRQDCRAVANHFLGIRQHAIEVVREAMNDVLHDHMPGEGFDVGCVIEANPPATAERIAELAKKLEAIKQELRDAGMNPEALLARAV
jgi:hypothetical protein